MHSSSRKTNTLVSPLVSTSSPTKPSTSFFIPSPLWPQAPPSGDAKEPGNGLQFGPQDPFPTLQMEELRPKEGNSFPGSHRKAVARLRLPRHSEHIPLLIFSALPHRLSQFCPSFTIAVSFLLFPSFSSLHRQV